MAEKSRGTSWPDWPYEEADYSADVRQIMGGMVQMDRRLIGLVPIPKGDIANAGNLSCRTKDGCLITRSGCSLKHLEEEDWIEVIDWDPELWLPTGRGPAPNEPSSEIGAHWAIYQARSDVNFIVHLHSHDFVAYSSSLGAALTEKEHPYGTPEFTEEIIKVLGSNNLVCLRGPEHIGFFALGESIDQVEALIADCQSKINQAKSKGTIPTSMTCSATR